MKPFMILFMNLLLLTPARSQPDLHKTVLFDYLQNHQYDEAISYISLTLTKDTNNLQILGYLGYINFMNDNTGSALGYYQKIIRLDTNNVSALEYLMRIDNGRHPETDSIYIRRLIQLKPYHSLYYRQMAGLFTKLRLKDSALIYYRNAYTLSPKDSKNAVGYADILLNEKNFSKADSILKSTLDRDSMNTNCLKLCVRSAYESKNYQAAIQPGEKLIALEECSLEAMTELLISYFNLKEYDNCLRICENLLRNDVQLETVYYYDAKAYAQLKDPEKSNELLQICVAKSISKTAELYYFSLGENYETLKNYKKAIANYDTAYYLFKNPVMLYNSGRISEMNLHLEHQAKKYYSFYLKQAKPQTPGERKAYEFVKRRFLKKQ